MSEWDKLRVLDEAITLLDKSLASVKALNEALPNVAMHDLSVTIKEVDKDSQRAFALLESLSEV